MSGLSISPQAAVEMPTAAPHVPVVRGFSVTIPLNNDPENEAKRRARNKLLRFILDNHNRRQSDAIRGLRSSGVG
jgi:hypothetical protein